MNYCEICGSLTKTPNIMEIRENTLIKRKVLLCPTCRRMLETRIRDGQNSKKAMKEVIDIRAPDNRKFEKSEKSWYNKRKN